MTDTIDPRNNPESQVAEGEASQTQSSTSESGPVPSDFPEQGQTPAEADEAAGVPAGTAAGDPLAGVTISPEDADEAVSGDTGPEHPGARRDAQGGPA